MIDGHFKNIPGFGTVNPDRTGDGIDFLKVECRYIFYLRCDQQLTTR